MRTAGTEAAVARRRRRTPRAAPAVAVLALLAGSAGAAGCSGAGAGSGARDGADAGRGPAAASAKGRPILPAKAARAVVAHYNKVDNTANRERKKSLAATIETGAVLERTTADYQLYPTLPAGQQRELTKPFTYTKVRTYVPDHGDWFAATARTNTSHTPRLLVFRKQKPAATGVRAWRLAALVGLEEKLPRIDTGPRGAAATVEPRVRSGRFAPEQLAAAYTDLYVTGGRKAGADLDRSTEPVRRALKIHRERDSGLGGAGVVKTFAEAEPEHPRVFALRTHGGGVLAVAPAAHTVRTEARRKGVRVTPSSAEAAYNGSARALVTDEQSGQLAAVLPPSGRPRVLGAVYALIDSR